MLWYVRYDTDWEAICSPFRNIAISPQSWISSVPPQVLLHDNVSTLSSYLRTGCHLLLVELEWENCIGGECVEIDVRNTICVPFGSIITGVATQGMEDGRETWESRLQISGISMTWLKVTSHRPVRKTSPRFRSGVQILCRRRGTVL
jgi:hypothetical protein